MKVFSKTSYFLFGGLAAILIAGFIVGSFLDLQISQSVANLNSTFGMICASFGELFGWGMMSVFGAIALRLAQRVEKKLFKVLLILFAVLVFGVAFYLTFADMNSSHNGFKEVSHVAVRIVLALLLQGGIASLAFWLIDTEDTKLLLSFWIILMIAFYLGLAINFISKGIISRPRYRLIYSGYGDYSTADLFENWYEAESKGLAESVYPADVVSSDDFKSFPSGHSFMSMSSILLCYLPFLNKKAQNKAWIRYVVFAFFACYGLMIEFARILYGAHYLSDVTCGGLLAVVCAFFIPFIGFKALSKKGILKTKE